MAYLRRQRVVVGVDVSNRKCVLRWVPQESLLGTIVVLIYIIDLDYGITKC